MADAGQLRDSDDVGDAPPLRYTDEELRAICEEAIAQGEAQEQADRANIFLRLRRVARELADVCSALLAFVSHD